MSAPHLTVRRAALDGFRDLSPVMLGMAPFGLVAGIAAIEAGLPLWGGNAFSLILFAGASQIAALDLIGRGVAAPIVIGTVLVINARMLMYSASLAPHMGRESLARRAGMAYLLTDQAYAVTITKLGQEPDHPQRFAYFMGGALPLWGLWQCYTAVGAVAGSAIPDDLPIGFAIPLCFLALLVPAVQDRPTLAAAVSSGLVATLAAGLPANLGLLAAAATGITVGTLVSRRARAGGRPSASPVGAAPAAAPGGVRDSVHDSAQDGPASDGGTR